MALRGSFHVLTFDDVAEQLRLEAIRSALGARPASREPSFRHPAPEYVRFEQPPVVEPCEPVSAASGDRFEARIKYYDYGIVSLEMELPFECGWDELIQRSAKWIASTELDRTAHEIIRRHVKRIEGALVDPYKEWISEEYFVIRISPEQDEASPLLTAAELCGTRGREIAQLVRGESLSLAESVTSEALQSALSYYPTDLMVAGWVAAFICDSPEGAAPTIQLLEYANTQLLQYRHYDDALSKVLAGVYQALEHEGGRFRRWRLTPEAERLNAMRLDVMELSERTDNAIKFLSDMFYARVYKVAAARIGVTDYRTLVEEKLKTAGELYGSMMNEFHQARAFALEAMVVAILIVDLIMLFRGQK